MGLEFMESGTPYALNDISSILRRWTHAFGSVGANNSGIGGRRSITLIAGSSIFKTLTHKASWTIGWRFHISHGSGNDFGAQDIYQGFNVGTRIVFLRLELDGTFTIRTGSTVIASSTFSIHSNAWYYFEIKYTLTDLGTDISIDAEFRVDGDAICSGTHNAGIDPHNLINQMATVNMHTFTAAGGTTDLMDMYILSAETYWGDVKLGKIVPNGDVTSHWSATGSPAYAQVNEVPPDDDASYIYSSTPGDDENFDWEDISPFSGVIKGVQYSICARKDDEGSRAISHTVGNTGAIELTSDPFYIDDSYVYYHIPLENDPATSAQWTRANFNAKRFGVLHTTI